MADAKQLYSYRQDPAVPAFPDDQPLLSLCVCVLCSGGAAWLMRHDKCYLFCLLPPNLRWVRHYKKIGPSTLGKFEIGDAKNFGYELVYLFGATPASHDETFK